MNQLNDTTPNSHILLANPRGFCAGVDRAILIVERAIERLGAPIYVRHEVVHNKFVVNDLKEKGAIFVKELDEVPDGATVIFSAHGVSKSVQNEAKQRDLQVFDATCPLVTKVHIEVSRYSKLGYEVVLIGHAGHPEVIGTMGQYSNADAGIYLVESTDDVETLQVKDPTKLYHVTQTTLSVDETRSIIDALKAKFPAICGPRQDDICYATQNRQDAVRELAKQCDLVLVVGSVNSSNSNRLRELAEDNGALAYLIDNASEIHEDWLLNSQRIGVTAGASAPEVLVQDVIAHLRRAGKTTVSEISGIEETIHFVLPKPLR
ncbi:4-hydroxy-3-methylbut-2-enyl diphosphate reductase [Ostreibacterium oceani]|uniref:4-hydroxy-3-methylbut-2-enyl diphosphate reductase n=1 Tax=Ostreibacterium oceani TaxID=2654998 RepID=A0A6N7EY54_9GAMM|nr:4-hydroxy-3-methylbut-2-enyl diphosphate reductase [Ostreibacterium oceani]MPV86505.1 4-hydroxy-3-methylbut-2-enyl diphosphate reductase [Ostreibacterium oceani]